VWGQFRYPTIAEATLVGETITISVGGLGERGKIEVRTALGFEILGDEKQWRSVAIVSSTNTTVSLGCAPAGALAVRYLWRNAPCGNAAPYQCPVYVTVPTLGKLLADTEQEALPLGPFLVAIQKMPR
jgi:hypothetical protein